VETAFLAVLSILAVGGLSWLLYAEVGKKDMVTRTQRVQEGDGRGSKSSRAAEAGRGRKKKAGRKETERLSVINDGNAGDSDEEDTRLVIASRPAVEVSRPGELLMGSATQPMGVEEADDTSTEWIVSSRREDARRIQHQGKKYAAAPTPLPLSPAPISMATKKISAHPNKAPVVERKIGPRQLPTGVVTAAVNVGSNDGGSWAKKVATTPERGADGREAREAIGLESMASQPMPALGHEAAVVSRRPRGPQDDFGSALTPATQMNAAFAAFDANAMITIALLVRCPAVADSPQPLTLRVASAYRGQYDLARSLPMRRSIVDPAMWVLTLRVPQYTHGAEFLYKYFVVDGNGCAALEEPGEPRRIFLGDKDCLLPLEQEDLFAAADSPLALSSAHAALVFA
jgi:hypothetical protein